ncbi:MAG TPA: TetR/AcrR family transcriptional regulator [Nocardioidaceae bacterium]|nr:TetR/AcrR family transcriptional regulator [Nocardioidaceae bacterium]
MTTARERVVEAAISIAARDGVPALTLDAVAAEAGVSKGGLLYHFASKEALLAGMVESALTGWSADIDAAVGSDPVPTGRAARAYLRSACDPGDDPSRELALLTAAALDPRCAQAWRTAVDGWAAADGPELDLLVTRLAADGLWLARALGLYGLDAARIAAVTDRVTELTRDPRP